MSNGGTAATLRVFCVDDGIMVRLMSSHLPSPSRCPFPPPLSFTLQNVYREQPSFQPTKVGGIKSSSLSTSFFLSPSPSVFNAEGQVLPSADQPGPDQHAQGGADREQEGLQEGAPAAAGSSGKHPHQPQGRRHHAGIRWSFSPPRFAFLLALPLMIFFLGHVFLCSLFVII